jgi:phage gp36-like protein
VYVFGVTPPDVWRHLGFEEHYVGDPAEAARLSGVCGRALLRACEEVAGYLSPEEQALAAEKNFAVLRHAARDIAAYLLDGELAPDEARHAKARRGFDGALAILRAIRDREVQPL